MGGWCWEWYDGSSWGEDGSDGGSNDGDTGNDSSGSCGDVWCTRR